MPDRSKRWDVFISHSSQDAEMAQRVCDALRADGWRPFLAAEHLNVEVGSAAWSRAVDEALDKSGAVLLLASQMALKSRWVEYEWRSTHDDILAGADRMLIPLCFEQLGPRDLPRALRRHQAVDVRKPPGPSGFMVGLERVDQLLRGHLGPPRGTIDEQRPAWAKTAGQDQYGRYADAEIAGVPQRMRWIPAGRFVMGSPGSESGRREDEREHEVELTEGFWLGDTGCTQALWTAVMGDNPSHFKSEELPVEQVSWDDCQRFLSRCQELSPGLSLTLPTEAQWEYACRAGTRTPFWFGMTITPEQANYDGNYPYAGATKGKFRERTVGVKELPCNGWGLHQMHGNIWEWCQPWYGPFPSGSATDPFGPAEGPGRVVRGGSWYFYAHNVRSARRAHLPQGHGDRYCGLRVARCQTSR